jgi:hypothetical protein
MPMNNEAKQVRIIIAITIFIALSGTTVSAQMTGKQRTSSAQRETLPRFDDFPTVEKFQGKPHRVDLSSHPNARTFRTRLREGAQKGANFAGHFALVSWGCGNECGQGLVIDLRTGKVYGLAEPPSERSSGRAGSVKGDVLEFSRGVKFRLTSKLLIADPPCPNDYNPCVSFGRSGEPIRYYIMEDDGLRLIHKTPCRLVIEKQRCGD